MPDAEEKRTQTVNLEATAVKIEKRGIKLRQTVVNTSGLGDTIDNSDSWNILMINTTSSCAMKAV